MPLINLTTNLKDLKYGHDTPYGGNSTQPYIQTPIPENPEHKSLNHDFILRGGSKAVTDSIVDVKRLGEYFTDTKSPNGLLFTAKQLLLSRTAVRTQSSGILNGGIYTPLSTLAEAGGVAFGLHVNKQGLNPFAGLFAAGTATPDQYFDNIKVSNNPDNVNTRNWSSENRLYALYSFKILNEDTLTKLNRIRINKDRVNVLTYPGGPGSDLGLGRTHIRFATDNTGSPLRTGTESSLLRWAPRKFTGTETQPIKDTYLTLEGTYKSIPTNVIGNVIRFLGASKQYNDRNRDINSPESAKLFNIISINGNEAYAPSSKLADPTILPSILSPNIDNTTDNLGGKEFYTYNKAQLRNTRRRVGKNGETTPGDFREVLRLALEKNANSNNSKINEQQGSIPKVPSYSQKNIESRVNLGDPGNRNGKNLISYANGAGIRREQGAASVEGNKSYDKINWSPIYSSANLGSNATFGEDKNDLVKFAISVLDTRTNRTNHIHFRAFLDQISDSYSADWNSTQYIGRGEKFYNYTGFDRRVSLSWTVAAQSKAELIPMYKKLNYLASICAPNYSPSGYMQGNIVKLTIGGYFYEQPGIITGLSYEMNDDNATWEIGIDEKGEFDSSVKELPHLIKVTGFNFIPIHTFVPKLQELVLNAETPDKTELEVEKYGNQKYIALFAGGKEDNYTNDVTPLWSPADVNLDFLNEPLDPETQALLNSTPTQSDPPYVPPPGPNNRGLEYAFPDDIINQGFLP